VECGSRFCIVAWLHKAPATVGGRYKCTRVWHCEHGKLDLEDLAGGSAGPGEPRPYGNLLAESCWWFCQE
jgi:hypothetical protein